MAEAWLLVYDIVILLGAALLLGVLFERLRQSALVGYLLAGTLLGPSAFGLVKGGDAVNGIAEIGVAMLLFTIGLEFSWRTLVGFGRVALGGGVLQLALTTALVGLIGVSLGLDAKGAIALGLAAALSSTAIVLRLLKDNNEIDSSHGRIAMGVLLLQDVALVPALLVVTFMHDQGQGTEPIQHAGLVAVKAIGLALVLGIVAGYLLPRFLDARHLAKNRELPILTSITTCVAATWAAHMAGVSPSLGAFLSGVLLAESKFADQVRADILPLRTAFVTLFFASIGLLLDLRWVGAHLPLVLGVAAGVVIVKALIAYFSIRVFHPSIIGAIAAGLCLGQLGEFSFVLAGIARDGGLLDDFTVQLVVSVTVATMFVTPYLVTKAFPFANAIARRLYPPRKLVTSERASRPDPLAGHVILVGFGDAGQVVAQELAHLNIPIVVLEVNPKLIRLAELRGLAARIGDATQMHNLLKASLQTAACLVVAIPDTKTARLVISQAKLLASHVPVVARSRYHVLADELDMSGADLVVDEELLVGRTLGRDAAWLIGSLPKPPSVE